MACMTPKLQPKPVFSSCDRFCLCPKEWIACMAGCAGIDVCGDDVRRGCRFAVVERCRNRTLFKAPIQKRVLRTTAYRTGVLCFLKHHISCVFFKESSMREFQAD